VGLQALSVAESKAPGLHLEPLNAAGDRLSWAKTVARVSRAA
jgi:hypothetical protein